MTRLHVWMTAVVLLASTVASPMRAGGAESQVLAMLNDARAQAGCRALVVNPALTRAARSQSNAMAAQNFFSHTGKDGHKFTYRVKAQGYSYHLIAENIAAGQSSPALVVDNWLHSPGHRRNILNCKFVETGIALTYQADDQPLHGFKHPLHYYWVQVFGKP